MFQIILFLHVCYRTPVNTGVCVLRLSMTRNTRAASNYACHTCSSSSGPNTSSGTRLPVWIIFKTSMRTSSGNHAANASSLGSLLRSFGWYSKPSGYPNCCTDCSMARCNPRAGTTGGRCAVRHNFRITQKSTLILEKRRTLITHELALQAGGAVL